MSPVQHLRRLLSLLILLTALPAASICLGLRVPPIHVAVQASVFLGASAILLPLARTWIKLQLLRRQRWGLPAVIYGTPEAAATLADALGKERGLGYHPIGCFAPRGAQPSDTALPILGGIDAYTLAAVTAFVLPGSCSTTLCSQLLDGPLARYRRVVILSDLMNIPALWVAPREFFGILGLEVTNVLEKKEARALKLAMESLMSAVILPFCLPLMLLIAVLVWLEDRRHPFFLQPRVGYRGRIFRMIKFRTMKVDADHVLQEALSHSPALAAEWNRGFKLKVDPRITRVGAFLRKTSLDELPQLLNVLRLDMSIIGPRPLPPYHVQTLPDSVQRLRNKVRPGITGLWQVSGRSDAGTAGMERWDTYYVRNWSFWLDTIIMVRTLRVVLGRKGAY